MSGKHDAASRAPKPSGFIVQRMRASIAGRAPVDVLAFLPESQVAALHDPLTGDAPVILFDGARLRRGVGGDKELVVGPCFTGELCPLDRHDMRCDTAAYLIAPVGTQFELRCATIEKDGKTKRCAILVTEAKFSHGGFWREDDEKRNEDWKLRLNAYWNEANGAEVEKKPATKMRAVGDDGQIERARLLKVEIADALKTQELILRDDRDFSDADWINIQRVKMRLPAEPLPILHEKHEHLDGLQREVHFIRAVFSCGAAADFELRFIARDLLDEDDPLNRHAIVAPDSPFSYWRARRDYQLAMAYRKKRQHVRGLLAALPAEQARTLAFAFEDLLVAARRLRAEEEHVKLAPLINRAFRESRNKGVKRERAAAGTNATHARIIEAAKKAMAANPSPQSLAALAREVQQEASGMSLRQIERILRCAGGF